MGLDHQSILHVYGGVMIRVWIVFKYIRDNVSDSMVDSVWRDMNKAYDRMVSLKTGGYMERHEVSY